MKSCDGCGEKATDECPYCGADSCAECVPICDHDARPQKAKLYLVEIAESPQTVSLAQENKHGEA